MQLHMHTGAYTQASTPTTHLFMICFPTSVDPVNPIFLTSILSTRAWPTSLPFPGIMLTHPRGKSSLHRELCKLERSQRSDLMMGGGGGSEEGTMVADHTPIPQTLPPSLSPLSLSSLSLSSLPLPPSIHCSYLSWFQDHSVSSCQAGGHFPRQHH